MKKIISLVLVIAIVLSITVFSVSAADNTDKNKRRLELFVNYYTDLIEMIGDSHIYNETDFDNAVYEAEAVFNNPSSTDEDFVNAYFTAKDALYNQNLDPMYAYRSVEKALRLDNDNNYYPQEDWNAFQIALVNLKAAVDDYSGSYNTDFYYDEDIWEYRPGVIYTYTDEQTEKITELFHEMLYSYNSMTYNTYIMGDVNLDGSVDVNDALYIQKYSVGKYKYLTNPQESNADVDGDGNVSILDAMNIQKYSVDKISEFAPYESFLTKLQRFEYSYESLEFLKRHVVNFDICPYTGDLPVFLSKKEYISKEIQEFYNMCIKEGIEY